MITVQCTTLVQRDKFCASPLEHQHCSTACEPLTCPPGCETHAIAALSYSETLQLCPGASNYFWCYLKDSFTALASNTDCSGLEQLKLLWGLLLTIIVPHQQNFKVYCKSAKHCWWTKQVVATSGLWTSRSRSTLIRIKPSFKKLDRCVARHFRIAARRRHCRRRGRRRRRCNCRWWSWRIMYRE